MTGAKTTDIDVAVVGAGMAGLTAAHELHRAGLSVRVFEQHHQVGGRMRSFRQDGWTVDQGAEQVPGRGYRATRELLTRLGVPDSDMPPVGGGVTVWRGGRARHGVGAPSALLTGGSGLGLRARRELAGLLGHLALRKGSYDSDHPERTPLGAVTVRELAARYHPDLHDYLLQPMVGSFFGWDTARSAAAPMAALLAEAGPPSGWRTYRTGMDLLARRLAETVDVTAGDTVREVIDDGGRALVRSDTGEVAARAAVLAVPAPHAAQLHPEVPADERDFLSASTFTPALKVSCLLDRPLAPSTSHPLYLMLTPAAEEDVLSAVIVDHAKHLDRAPQGKGLLTLMAAPGTVPNLLEAPEEEVAELLTSAAERYVPGLAEATLHRLVHPFRHALPEATPAALHRRGRFMARPARTVEYAGDWVMVCPASEGAVRSGALAASRVLSRIGPPAPAATHPLREVHRETA